MGVPGHKGSRRPQWKIDNLEKALVVIEGMRMLGPNSGRGEGSSVSDCLRFILGKYPDLGLSTHEHIADILGIARESVTRGMNFREKRAK